MPVADTSYAFRMRNIQGGLTAVFRAANPTVAQQNSRVGAVEQGFRILRTEGALPKVTAAGAAVGAGCGC